MFSYIHSKIIGIHIFNNLCGHQLKLTWVMFNNIIFPTKCVYLYYIVWFIHAKTEYISRFKFKLVCKLEVEGKAVYSNFWT